MKKIPKIFTCLALAAACAVSAAACQTKSNLKKEGWEEFVDSAFSLETYSVWYSIRENGNPNGENEMFEIDTEAVGGLTAHYRKEQSADDADRYFAIRTVNEVEKVWTYNWEQNPNGEGNAWVRRDATPSDAEATLAAFTSASVAYDLRREMIGLNFYPEGQTDAVKVKDLYDHLKYDRGDWTGNMAFELRGERHDGTVKVKMPDNIESARESLSTGGILFSVTMLATVDGVELEWSYAIYSTTMSNLSLPVNYQTIE